jgi:hypothetical protein
VTTVTPVNPRGSAEAVLTEDIDDIEGPVPAGVFEYFVSSGGDGPAGLLFGCPCGCGELKTVGFDTHESRRPRWHWDGNREQPTLTPSILIYQLSETGAKTGEHWHGFLTNGVFKSC